MHVDIVPNREAVPTVLLRESYREDGKTKKRTLANLSHWPAEQIEQLRAVLRGERLLPAAEAIEITGRCRTAMCSPRSVPRAGSSWTPCCRAERRNESAISRSP